MTELRLFPALIGVGKTSYLLRASDMKSFKTFRERFSCLFGGTTLGLLVLHFWHPQWVINLAWMALGALVLWTLQAIPALYEDVTEIHYSTYAGTAGRFWWHTKNLKWILAKPSEIAKRIVMLHVTPRDEAWRYKNLRGMIMDNMTTRYEALLATSRKFRYKDALMQILLCAQWGLAASLVVLLVLQFTVAPSALLGWIMLGQELLLGLYMWLRYTAKEQIKSTAA